MYIKNGIIKELKNISVVKDGRRYYNVSEAMAFADGWETYTPSVRESVAVPLEEQYKNRVSELIRARYSIDDEVAILRQRDSKPEEFDTYNAYAESCKQQAREELGI
jgi:hypothetical protein